MVHALDPPQLLPLPFPAAALHLAYNCPTIALQLPCIWPRDAAEAHEQAQQWGQAGRLWEELKEWPRAAHAFKNAGLPKRAAESLQEAGCHVEAAARA